MMSTNCEWTPEFLKKQWWDCLLLPLLVSDAQEQQQSFQLSVVSFGVGWKNPFNPFHLFWGFLRSSCDVRHLSTFSERNGCEELSRAFTHPSLPQMYHSLRWNELRETVLALIFSEDWNTGFPFDPPIVWTSIRDPEAKRNFVARKASDNWSPVDNRGIYWQSTLLYF